ncbi:GroES-like protein [Peniophora sp. CONT]|nr:GroES-like protein [Peniophora sp. CONT]
MAASALPEQQTALLISVKGQRMTVGKRAVPKPGAGQVLVHNIAAAIAPADMYIQKYGVFLKDEDLPAVIGEDGAGEVSALGEGVQGWNIGDKVLYEGCMAVSNHSTFQEYTIVDVARIARIPPNITPEQAASVPLALATAALGLYKPKSDVLHPAGYDLGGAGLTPPWTPGGMGKYAGQAALVIGGSSSVGQLALQLLHASGFSPLITTASAQNEDYCKASGATHVVDYKTTPYDQLPTALKPILGDTPISIVYNAIAIGTQAAAFAVLAPGGSMASVVKPDVGVRGKDDEQGRRVIWVYGDVNLEEHKAFGGEMFGSLTGMLERGELKPTKVQVLEGGLGAVPAGCDELEKGVSAVKLVVRVRD